MKEAAYKYPRNSSPDPLSSSWQNTAKTMKLLAEAPPANFAATGEL
jgi:hypothetical protein